MPNVTLPALIDCHVHFREPGGEHKATMATEALAAKAGGVGIVCEMPNTNPPVTSIAALEDKVRRAKKIKDCDIRFYMGATDPRHLLAIRDVWRLSSPHMQELKKRCAGLKLYFDHSTGNQGASEATLEAAFEMCGNLGIPIIAHCEDPEMNRLAAGKWPVETSDVSAHSAMRPPESEAASIDHAIGLARKHDAALHVAHLSTMQGIDLVAKAKREGLKVTCEVAPHHLFLTVDDYKRLGTLAKMNPPLRTKEHRDALWEGIESGTVDCIATDHAPHTVEEKKTQPPLKSPSGVPGVETMLPLLLTVAAGGWPHPVSSRPSVGSFSLKTIEQLCFENPNRIFQLRAERRLMTIDTDATWEIHGKDLHSKCGWTPYEGWKVRGKIIS